MTFPLISIIVPIYNVEPYLRESLDAIIHQTYSNLEIILVDDGSPDHCAEICDEYALKDKRIKVIHQTNAGVGNARNTGLDAMTGAYCIFPDPDDCMDADSIEYLYHLMMTHSMATPICSYKTDKHQPMPEEKLKIIPQELLIKSFFEYSLFNVCMTLFDTQKIGSLRFSTYYQGEDAVFSLKYFKNIQSVVFSNLPKIYYRTIITSVTKRPFSERDFEILDAHKELINLTTDYTQERNLAVTYYILRYRYIKLKILKSKQRHNTKKQLEKYREYAKELCQKYNFKKDFKSRFDYYDSMSAIFLPEFLWCPLSKLFYAMSFTLKMVKKMRKN